MAECSNGSAILSTFIRLPFIIKVFVLSTFEWQLKTDSQARAQRLSRAHQKVTWSMLIGVTNFHHQTKQRLPV